MRFAGYDDQTHRAYHVIESLSLSDVFTKATVTTVKRLMIDLRKIKYSKCRLTQNYLAFIRFNIVLADP